MKNAQVLWLTVAATLVLTLAASGQPPGGGRGQPPGRREGFPGGQPPGGPPRFELGRVLPPFAREELKLSREQERQIADLENEVKERLNKILTADQKKQLENLRPRGPGGPPPGGGPGRPGGPPPGERRDPPPDGSAARQTGGIQWYATLDGGLQEAQRANKPILLLAAAPHCAGVSGIW
jgi:hypothetical protein